MKPKKPKSQLLYVINPTPYEDYDILALGSIKDLKKLAKQDAFKHYISSSTYSIPLVVVDTCNSIKDAVKYIKELRGDLTRGIE